MTLRDFHRTMYGSNDERSKLLPAHFTPQNGRTKTARKILYQARWALLIILVVCGPIIHEPEYGGMTHQIRHPLT